MDVSVYQTLAKNEDMLKVACFYADINGEISSTKTYWKKFQKKEGFSEKEIENITRKLCKLGYVYQNGYDWYAASFAYAVHPSHCIPFLYLLYTEHPLWIRSFEECAVGESKPSIRLRMMVKLALEGKAEEIDPDWFVGLKTWLLSPVALDPQLGWIALRMPDNQFVDYIVNCIVGLAEEDVLDTENFLPQLVQRHKFDNPQIQAKVQDYLALYRYYSHGEYTPTANPVRLNQLILEGVHAAHHREYAKAIVYFDAALKIRNKDSKDKNLFENTHNCYFLIMTYVHEGSEASIAKLHQFLNKKIVSERDNLLPARIVASTFTDIRQEAPEHLIRNLLLPRNERLKQYFGFLFTEYFKNGAGKALKAKDYYPKQAIMQHELSAYLPLKKEDLQRLHSMYGDAPLLTSIHRKETWEVILENLAKEEESGKESAAESNVRLGYFIHYGSHLEVREQTRLKSGRWGSGKVVSTSRYSSGQIECMDEVDRAIWSRWRKSGSYYDVHLKDALPELVGTDRLYTGGSGKYEPVSVTSEKPYLMVEKKEDGFYVTSNYPPLHDSDRLETADCIMVRKDDMHYVVIPLSGKQRRYYEQLISIGKFPLHAENVLKEFFPKVSQTVEVHSPLVEGGSTLETKDGDSIVCLQIQPRDDMFLLRLYVRPLPAGKAFFVPGEGAALIIDEDETGRKQVKRSLAQENVNRRLVETYLEDVLEVYLKGNVVDLDAEQLLSLLDYVRQIPENCCVEWPEGEKMRLRLAAEPSKWNVSLNSNGGWFDVEGDIALDDETIMSMGQLLELIGQSRGKFIRLNENEYLRLNDNLRKQLAKLEALSVKNRGKMQISSLQAGLLNNDVLDGELKINYDQTLTDLRQRIADSKSLSPKVPAKLQATLRDYQLDGFRWMARLNSWGAGACLADDMGLGKTIQTIAYLLLKAKEGASLVVAPASVVPNWKKELQRFAPVLNASILNESDNRQDTVKKAKKFDVVLSSYGLLVSEEELLTSKAWNIVCLDEAHTIKNRETKTSDAAMKLEAKGKVILTGTPIQNHLGELWNLFRFINPGLLGSYECFNQKYITPISLNKDKQRQQQLNRIVHPFMLRRTKQEVVEELPDKQEIVLPVELSTDEMAAYEAIRIKAQEMLAEGGVNVNVATLSEITRLRQAACCTSLVEKKWTGGCSKIDTLLSLMEEIKAGGNRALIFSQFTSLFALVRKELDKAGIEYLYLDGSTPMKQRDKLVQQFQQEDCPFFLISLKAGGLGLNLTGANYIVHLDPWWNPAIEQQATDRAYRIGQEQKVTVYHLISSHTIEEKIVRLHETKRNLADALLEGTDMSHKLTAQELMDMLEEK